MSYPLLSKLPKAPASLCPQLRTILLAAGHVAAGDAGATVAAFRHINPNLHGKAYELAILQAAPFTGIPRVLHSAAALQSIGITGDYGESFRSKSGVSNEMMRKQGENTFQTIYGRNESRVRQRLRTFHPALEDWIVTCVYGWMVSRTDQEACGVTLRERELSAIASLCVDTSAGVQLVSHIRGAILTGATPEEVESVVRQTEGVCEAAAPGALAVWQTYGRARYAL